MKPEKIINELIEVEAMCDTLKQKAYSTRTKLERFYAPAFKTNSKKAKKAESDIVKKFRLSIAKKQIKANA